MTEAVNKVVYNPLVMKRRVERKYEVYEEGENITNNDAVAEGVGMPFNRPTLSKDRYSSKIVDVISSPVPGVNLDIINEGTLPPTSFLTTFAGGGCENSFGETSILPPEPLIEAALVPILNLIGDIYPESVLTAKQRNQVRRWTKRPIKAKQMTRVNLEAYSSRYWASEFPDDMEFLPDVLGQYSY